MSQRRNLTPAVPESAFREAVAQADIAISITDTQANILYVNPALERVAIALLDGEERVVLDNREYKELADDLGMAEPAGVILDAVRAAPGRGLGAARDGAQAFADHEIRVDPAGGRPARWFSCTGTWVKRIGDGADAFFGQRDSLYLLLLAREVTRQKARQERARMAALRATMAEENRVGALRESLSAALFQMEGPLNVLASVVALQARRGRHDPTAAALGEALAAGQTVLDTLRRAIPAPTAEAATLANINALLRDVLELATGRLLATGVTVNWRPQAVLPAVQGYPIRLRALFKALVDNALEAMNVKGWSARELTVTTRALPGGVEAIIEDSGPGIPPELRLKAFEPFCTTKPRHAGTGLAMAQQIVADHGGTIGIDAAHHAGCRMRVVLPTQGNTGERL